MKKVGYLLFCFLALFVILSACSPATNETPNEGTTGAGTQTEQATQAQEQEEVGEPAVQDGPITFGSTFQFDGSSGLIEIGFGTDVFWGEVENSFSPHYGSSVFGIPVTVRNLSSRTGGLNAFDFSLFGSSGLSLDSIGTFFDHDIAWESNMRAGASQTGLLYFLYDGDGEYVIEFSAGFGFGDSAEAFFEIEYASDPPLSAFDINAFPPSTFVPLTVDGAFTLGDSFEFNGSSGRIEITLGTDISWTEITNTWSEHYGATVFAIPVTITNIDTETGGINMFDISQFGSHGLRLRSVGIFLDNDITMQGDMRPGATAEGNLYFLYVGDGQYAIEFTAGLGFGDFIEVVFDITR